MFYRIELVSYTSDEICNAFNFYVIKHSLASDKCVGIYSDGAASMVSRHCGVAKRIQQVVNFDLLITHCIIQTTFIHKIK